MDLPNTLLLVAGIAFFVSFVSFAALGGSALRDVWRKSKAK